MTPPALSCQSPALICFQLPAPLAGSWEPNGALKVRGRRKKPCAISPAAPSAPTLVKFSELTTTSVNVSWEAPQFPNGVLEGYRLVYEPCTPVDGEWDPSACLTPTSRELSPSRGPLAATAVHVASPSFCRGSGVQGTREGNSEGKQAGGEAEERPGILTPRSKFSISSC